MSCLRTKVMIKTSWISSEIGKLSRRGSTTSGWALSVSAQRPSFPGRRAERRGVVMPRRIREEKMIKIRKGTWWRASGEDRNHFVIPYHTMQNGTNYVCILITDPLTAISNSCNFVLQVLSDGVGDLVKSGQRYKIYIPLLKVIGPLI